MTMLTNEAVTEITQEIWAALLASDGSSPLLPGDLYSGEVIAEVHISGEWNGTVRLSCSQVAARHATAAMFSMGDDEVTPADVADAIGELVNVVGGNIKGLVEAPSALSLPAVREGGSPAPLGQLELAQEVRFSWMAEPVVVGVWAEAT
ncbi:MAG TPA: chemotaxis protein CheX [Acidimicrobiales bacterium]|nr:chemotaxis protein CheX [Acidimicrobiales bacterium]